MKQLFSRIMDATRDCAHVLLTLAARLLRWLPGASWQGILAFCLALALLLAVLPLALLLFIAFLLIKLIVVAMLVPARKDKLLITPHQFDEKDGQ